MRERETGRRVSERRNKNENKARKIKREEEKRINVEVVDVY